MARRKNDEDDETERLLGDSQPSKETVSVDPVPLTSQQINYARDVIDERKRLADTQILIVWPFLRYICCCCFRRRKNFKAALQRSLRKKMAMRNSKSDLQIEQDPYLLLGFGMNSYFEVMLNLMCMMLFISCFAVALAVRFASYDALSATQAGFHVISMGNMGGAEAICEVAQIKDSQALLHLYCAAGGISTSVVAQSTSEPILQMGLIPSSAESFNQCSVGAVKRTTDCSSYLDSRALEAKIASDCNGRKSCSIKNLKSFFKGQVQAVSLAQLPSSFLDTYLAEKFEQNAGLALSLSQKASVDTDECLGEKTSLFVQVGCMLTEEEVDERKLEGLIIACLAVFIALFCLNYFDFVRKNQQLNYVEWDVKTITAGDYTVEFDIEPSFYEDWLDKEAENFLIEEQERSGKGYAARPDAFRDWITQEMERRLAQLPDLGYEDEPLAFVRVAVTTFAYKNGDIIHALRQRGACIKANDWEGIKRADENINIIKKSQLEQLTTPCSVFMSFECEEGINRALEFDKLVEADDSLRGLNVWLGEHKIEIQQASEPTDIIWENRQFTPGTRLFRSIFVTFVLVFLLACSFLLILLCSQSANRLLNKYPASIDCSTIVEGKSTEELQTQAIIEWSSLTAAEAKGQSVSYKGHVQCFCDLEASEDNQPADASYGSENLKICQDYQHSKLTTFLATNSITLIITVINQVLTKVSIGLITWVGYDTHSEMLTKITNGVFAAQFFNTAILILLVYANVTEVSPGIGNILDGQFRDYSPRWYTLVGNNIAQTMFLGAVMPAITEMMPVLISKLKRWADTGFSCAPDAMYNTKQTQIYAYIDLYVGPEHQIHFKYSHILNVTFVTMMYGLGMPILFPIAALSYLVFWAVERYQVAYTYPMPPALDDRLTENALDMLQFSPILLLANGYWMLSNKQIFDSEISPLNYMTDIMETGHTLPTVLTLDHATPLFAIALVVMCLHLFRVTFDKLMHRWGYVISKNEIKVDENLPPFFQAVPLTKADWILAENDNLKEVYGFNLMQREISEQLDHQKEGKKYIRGVCWYHVIANPSYARDFCYIDAIWPNRADFIVDGDDDEENDCEQSDMSQLVINIGLAPRQVIRQVSFGLGISHNFKREIKQQKFSSFGNLHPREGESHYQSPSKQHNIKMLSRP